MRTPRLSFLAALLAVLGGGVAGHGQTSFPTITHATPTAVQRGTTVEVTVWGQNNFSDIDSVFFEGDGLRAAVLGPARGAGEKAGPSRLTGVVVRLQVAADAAPGVRLFRLASPTGLSSVGQLVVVGEPVAPEGDDNDTRESATRIEPPCVVAGRLEEEEDGDCFRFRAEKGRTLTFEVYCARLQDRIHDLREYADPVLTLYDAAGRELAVNDDYYFADPRVGFTFATTGEYTVRIRDESSLGDPRWAYALRLTDRPDVAYVYPMAGNPGETISVETVGAARPLEPRPRLRVPTTPGLRLVELDLGGGPPAVVPFLVAALPQVNESEPNDAPARAHRVRVPCGINGRVGKAGDVDHFVFTAAKGKAVRFEVHARRYGTLLRSSLDSVLEVLGPDGAVLALNDDSFGKDAALEFRPPADGDYVLRVRDLTGQGGEAAVYHIEADWARPDFTLRTDPDRAILGPGASTPWYVRIERRGGFAGPVRIEVRGLPPGVTASTPTLTGKQTEAVVVLTADREAARRVANVRVVGVAPVPLPGGGEEMLEREATPLQEVYLAGGSRGRIPVPLQTVAVAAVSDLLSIEVTPRAVTLKPGAEVRLKVVIRRRPGFDARLSLNVVLEHLGQVYANPLPPSVSVVEEKSALLLGERSEGHIVLRAAPDAEPAEDVPIAVVVQTPINYLLRLNLTAPPVLLNVRR